MLYAICYDAYQSLPVCLPILDKIYTGTTTSSNIITPATTPLQYHYQDPHSPPIQLLFLPFYYFNIKKVKIDKMITINNNDDGNNDNDHDDDQSQQQKQQLEQQRQQQ